MTQIVSDTAVEPHVETAASGPVGCCCSADHLSNQDLAVLDQLANGRSNREIGKVLSLNPQTIAHRISELMIRFRCASRTGLVTLAWCAGVWEVGTYPPRRTGRRCIPGDLMNGGR